MTITTNKVTVVDYGIGNVHSVLKALRAAGGDVELSSQPAAILAAERVVLPGVGAFGDGMTGLSGRHLVEPVLEVMRRGRPFLGICLGMQMMLTESEEFGRHLGLGVIPGKVQAIPGGPGVKVPQIGWNRIRPRPGQSWKGTLLEHVEPGSMFYFVHSFTAMPSYEEARLADADYHGRRVSAAIVRDNVVGFQFHPEKSGELGLSILRRFVSR